MDLFFPHANANNTKLSPSIPSQKNNRTKHPHTSEQIHSLSN